MALADCPTDTVFSARERDSFSRAPSAAVRALARQLLAQHGISDSEIVRERGERGLLPPRVFSGGAARNDIQLSLSHDGDYVAEIGRASCRDRVCQYVSITEVAVSFQPKPTQATVNIPCH